MAPQPQYPAISAYQEPTIALLANPNSILAACTLRADWTRGQIVRNDCDRDEIDGSWDALPTVMGWIPAVALCSLPGSALAGTDGMDMATAASRLTEEVRCPCPIAIGLSVLAGFGVVHPRAPPPPRHPAYTDSALQRETAWATSPCPEC